MLRLRSIYVGRLGHFCSVGQRASRRAALTAKWRVVLAGPPIGQSVRRRALFLELELVAGLREPHVRWWRKERLALRARLERATYCLGGRFAPAAARSPRQTAASRACIWCSHPTQPPPTSPRGTSIGPGASWKLRASSARLATYRRSHAGCGTARPHRTEAPVATPGRVPLGLPMYLEGALPGLSDWEFNRIRHPECPTWESDRLPLTVTGPWPPSPMARQWPSDLESQGRSDLLLGDRFRQLPPATI